MSSGGGCATIPWGPGSDPGRLAIALTRSRDDRILAGVCGGIAEWLGWNSTLVRVLYVLVSVLSVAFPGILVYIVLWIVMPEAPSSHKAPTP